MTALAASLGAPSQLTHTAVSSTPPTRVATPLLAGLDRSTVSDLTLDDQQRFIEFGSGRTVMAPHQAIHRPIELHAVAQPDAIAARHGADSITYADLNRHAERLAALLLQLGVRPGDNVALFVQRSIPMLIGLLASLKIGAAYVPQDARIAPEPQLEHVMNAASTRVVLTLSSLRNQLPLRRGHVYIAIDEVMSQPFADVDEVGKTGLLGPDPDRNAFILFTSGTTGAPNGVQVTHGNLCNVLLTAPGDLGIQPGMAVAQILSISFDMAAWEILGCLSHGATLLIRGTSIQETVERADVVIATPTVLGSIDASRCSNIEVAAVAGEPCPVPLAELWSQHANFYNSCGPTETTIINTAQRFSPGRELTIGRPTPNNTVYVLDADLQPCPIGEVGEMWAGGDCVSAGYLGNDELTADRYRLDPFLGAGREMFRTRDLGRWNEIGELEHHGRTDDQVKVRGFRVELDSVSGALEAAPSCDKAVTLKVSQRSLVAFVTPATTDIDDALAHVSSRLPYYCTPEQVFAVDEFPMTSRGKVDKRQLLDSAQASMVEAAAAPEAGDPTHMIDERVEAQS